MTTTTVRELTADEKDRLSPLLHELHAHVGKCGICAGATRRREMCDPGRALYERWLQWLTDTNNAAPF